MSSPIKRYLIASQASDLVELTDEQLLLLLGIMGFDEIRRLRTAIEVYAPLLGPDDEETCYLYQHLEALVPLGASYGIEQDLPVSFPVPRDTAG